MYWNNSLYGNFRTRTFAEIWPDEGKFVDDVGGNPLNMDGAGGTNMEPAQLASLYYHLYAAYGNSHIANSDENQFKFKVYDIISRYGPTWAKRMEIQRRLRNMTDDELDRGDEQVYNKGYNPATTIYDRQVIDTVNEQTRAIHTRGKLESLSYQNSMLEEDVIGEFIRRFKPLFVTVVQPRVPLWYETKVDDDIIVGDEDDE